MPLHDHNYKYQMGINSHIPGKTKPNDFGTCSYIAFGDSTMTDEEAVALSKKTLDTKREKEPEALISGTLFEVSRIKDVNSRIVHNFEHKKEQPA